MTFLIFRLSVDLNEDKPNGDRQRFEEVSLAHEVLTDPARRRAHDEQRLQEVGTRKLRLRRSHGEDILG